MNDLDIYCDNLCQKLWGLDFDSCSSYDSIKDQLNLWNEYDEYIIERVYSKIEQSN